MRRVPPESQAGVICHEERGTRGKTHPLPAFKVAHLAAGGIIFYFFSGPYLVLEMVYITHVVPIAFRSVFSIRFEIGVHKKVIILAQVNHGAGADGKDLLGGPVDTGAIMFRIFILVEVIPIHPQAEPTGDHLIG